MLQWFNLYAFSLSYHQSVSIGGHNFGILSRTWVMFDLIVNCQWSRLKLGILIVNSSWCIRNVLSLWSLMKSWYFIPQGHMMMGSRMQLSHSRMMILLRLRLGRWTLKLLSWGALLLHLKHIYLFYLFI